MNNKKPLSYDGYVEASEEREHCLKALAWILVISLVLSIIVVILECIASPASLRTLIAHFFSLLLALFIIAWGIWWQARIILGVLALPKVREHTTNIEEVNKEIRAELKKINSYLDWFCEVKRMEHE